MEKLIEHPKPRTWHILKPWSRSRGKNQRVREKPLRQQTKRCHQQIPEGVAFEVPIRDLEPLQTLNAFRRDLGLGRSSNLISSAIYDYDPTTVAECYEKSITGGFPRCPQYFPSAQHQTEVGFLECFGAPIDGSTSDYETFISSLSYQHSIDTRPSTAQRSSDGNSVDTCPDHATPADQQLNSPQFTKDE